MLLTEKPAVYERRTSGQLSAGNYSPGITRIEQLVAEEAFKHDTSYLDHDDNEWQTKYSLMNHQARVAMVVTSVGRARGRTENDIQVGRVAALLHDMGKLHPECQNYRRKSKLSAEDRRVLTRLHSEHSANLAESFMSKVRAEDRLFLGRVIQPVRYHHEPDKIVPLDLREIGYDVNVSDIFVSIQEDRERPGMGLRQAVEFIEMLIPRAECEAREEDVRMFYQSKRAIIALYGLHLPKLG